MSDIEQHPIFDLREFLEMQRELQQRMRQANPALVGWKGGDPYEMNTEDLAAFITWNHTALVKELGEALDEVGWKPWASSRHCDADAAIKEMVDSWHFFLNMLLAIGAWSGWELEDIATFFGQYYAEKREINAQRQVEGYDGVSGKCPVCKRAIEVSNPWGSEANYHCSCGAVIRVNAKGEVMPGSTHDDEEVRRVQAEIEAANATKEGSIDEDELRRRVAAEHAARQAAQGYSPASPQPRGVSEGEAALPQETGIVPMFGSVTGKAAKIINEVNGTDEPIFVFRAKDIFSIMVVAHYISLLEQYGPEAHDMVISAHEQLEAMKAWQRANVGKVRYPD